MIPEETLDLLVRNEADMSFRRRVRTIFEWLDPQDGDHILDAGCGRAFNLKYIRHVSKCRLTGVELEYPFLRIARAELRGSDITLVNGSLYRLPFPDNTFDKAILSEVLEHLDDDVGGLREVVRVLRPGGLIAITVPNANYPFWWDPINKTLETLFHTHIQHGLLAGIWANHVRLYHREELRRVAQDAGLETVAERSFTHYAMPFTHNIVYGLGKTILEAGLLPTPMAVAADRYRYQENEDRPLNPVNLARRVLLFFDRRNVLDEPDDRSTVNLCLKGRKAYVRPQER